MPEEKSALEKVEAILKKFWRETGNAHLITARHTEFIVEPRIFLGDKLHPEILKLMVINYLAQATKQDSGIGENIEATPEKLVIKTPKGKPLITVRDRKLIQQYLEAIA